MALTPVPKLAISLGYRVGRLQRKGQLEQKALSLSSICSVSLLLMFGVAEQNDPVLSVFARIARVFNLKTAQLGL